MGVCVKGILISRQADNCCARSWRQFLKSPIWLTVEGFHRSSVLGESDLNKDLFSVGFGLHRLLFRVGGWSLKTHLLVSLVICFSQVPCISASWKTGSARVYLRQMDKIKISPVNLHSVSTQLTQVRGSGD